MGKIIAIANQKGGVGKTTTAINLAAGLAEKGKKALLIDLDSQSNATSGAGIEKNSVEKGTYEVLSGEATLEECVLGTAFENLFVVPTSVDLAAAEIELLDVEDRNEYLKNAIEPLKNQYDFIIIDCPPSLNMLTINAMVAANSVLVPIQCEYYALEGLSQLLQTIELVKERLNDKLEIEGLLFTMYDGRVKLSGQVVANVKQNLNEKIFKTVIPRNVRVAEAPSHGKPVMHYSRFCSGTRAYRKFAQEIIAANESWFKENAVAEEEAKEVDETVELSGENAETLGEEATETAIAANEENKETEEESKATDVKTSEENNAVNEESAETSEEAGEADEKTVAENSEVSEVGDNSAEAEKTNADTAEASDENKKDASDIKADEDEQK